MLHVKCLSMETYGTSMPVNLILHIDEIACRSGCIFVLFSSWTSQTLSLSSKGRIIFYPRYKLVLFK